MLCTLFFVFIINLYILHVTYFIKKRKAFGQKAKLFKQFTVKLVVTQTF